MIAIKASAFTQDILERLFGAYVLVNKSHWHCPPYTMVKSQLTDKGYYIHTAGNPENWSSKFTVTLDGDLVKVDIAINPQLPASMQKIAQRDREEILERMSVIVEQTKST